MIVIIDSFRILSTLLSSINRIIILAIIIIPGSCSIAHSAINDKEKLPKWYLTPKNNNGKYLFGVAEGSNLEEATKLALIDFSSKLLVKISSESQMIAEENRYSINEETRRNIQQIVEKVELSNFRVSNSEQIKNRLFVEIEVERMPFIQQQQQSIDFLQQQINDLQVSIKKPENINNPIKKRFNLQKILELSKRIEILARFINGAGGEVDIVAKLSQISSFKKQFEEVNDNNEFFITYDKSQNYIPAIAKLITKALNAEKINVATKINKSSHQIIVKITSDYEKNLIYKNYLVKMKVNFSNYLQDKIIASNDFEVTGASVVDEKQALNSAIANLEERINKEGILKILGIY